MPSPGTARSGQPSGSLPPGSAARADPSERGEPDPAQTEPFQPPFQPQPIAGPPEPWQYRALGPPPPHPAAQPSAYPGRPYKPPGYQRLAAEPESLGTFRPPPPVTGQPPGPPRQPPRRHDRGRRGASPAVWVTLLALIGGVAAAVLLLANPFGHQAGGGTAGAGSVAGASDGPTAAPGKTPPASPAVTERQAAASVAAMLSQSVADRTAINSAARDVGDCGPNLAADPKVFDETATSRQALLSRLAAIPGRATLPPALLSDLTRAWQASIAADQADARWAKDEIAKGCVRHDTSDPGYQASIAPDNEATTYKQDFTTQWNPIAARYGLAGYQPAQL